MRDITGGVGRALSYLYPSNRWDPPIQWEPGEWHLNLGSQEYGSTMTVFFIIADAGEAYLLSGNRVELCFILTLYKGRRI